MHTTMLSIFVFFQIVSSLTLEVIGVSQNLICKSVDDVIPGAGSSGPAERQHQLRSVQGLPGKRGPSGPEGRTGPQGSKGEKGNVDYKIVSDIIKREVNEGLLDIRVELKNLGENITDLHREVKEIQCAASGVLFKDSCYSIPRLSATRNINRKAAEQACSDVNARLAQIHDKTHQEVLGKLVRTNMPSSTDQVHLAIGMTYDKTKSYLRYKSGDEVAVDHLLWWDSYPRPALGIYMYLGVYKNKGSGIWNHGDFKVEGVICELNQW